jgi:hypothetical protein
MTCAGRPSGISCAGGEKAVMTVAGYKTRAVFDPYNIIAEEDLVATIERRDKYHGAQPDERKVVVLPL